MENITFYIQYRENEAVGVNTHISVERIRREFPLTSVAQLIAVYKKTVTPLLDTSSLTQLTLHLPVGLDRTTLSGDCFDPTDSTGNTLRTGLALTRLHGLGLDYLHPLIIKSRADTDVGHQDKFESFHNILRTVKQIVINADEQGRLIKKASDILLPVETSRSSPLKIPLYKFADVGMVRGTNPMLFSDELINMEVALELECPFETFLEQMNSYDAWTVAVIGASGCGKTRTCYNLSRDRFCLFFDCITSADFRTMIRHLQGRAPPAGEKTIETQVRFENFSALCILCCMVSRLIILETLQKYRNGMTPYDWLCLQLTDTFGDVSQEVSSHLQSLSLVTLHGLIKTLARSTRMKHVIFDECQDLLQCLNGEYRSMEAYKNGIVDGCIQHPRSLFSFAAHTMEGLASSTIWSGTHMRIRRIDLIASGVAKSTVKLFKDFTYLRPDHIKSLLTSFLNIEDQGLLEEMSYFLQGRPRFLTGFLHELCISSNQTLTLEQAFKLYIHNLTTNSGDPSSLYNYWASHFHQSIQHFDVAVGINESVCNLLIQLCANYLFGDQEAMPFDASCDMIATGLIMVEPTAIGWACVMSERLVLDAGLKYLSHVDANALMEYFAKRLFGHRQARFDTHSARRSTLQLIVTLRTLQGWWKGLTTEHNEHLPTWFCPNSIKQPSGVKDVCEMKGMDDINVFVRQLKEPDYPFVVLPSTYAGPDIRYSCMSFHCKTAWKNDHLKKSVVAENISTLDPTYWYAGDKSAMDKYSLCQEALKSVKKMFVIRVELPYLNTTEMKHYTPDLKSNWAHTVIHLDSPLAVPLFTENFMIKYKEFLTDWYMYTYE